MEVCWTVGVLDLIGLKVVVAADCDKGWSVDMAVESSFAWRLSEKDCSLVNIVEFITFSIVEETAGDKSFVVFIALV